MINTIIVVAVWVGIFYLAVRKSKITQSLKTAYEWSLNGVKQNEINAGLAYYKHISKRYIGCILILSLFAIVGIAILMGIATDSTENIALSFIPLLVILVVLSIPLFKKTKFYKTEKESMKELMTFIEAQKEAKKVIKESSESTSIAKPLTFRIISKVGILLVVLGFFMPVSCDLNGFEMAEYISKIEKSFSAIEGSSSNSAGVVMALYLVFISSLISGLLIIPLLMNRKLYNGIIDVGCLILSIGCGIYAYLKLEGLFSMYGEASGQKLQIGGYFILTGWIVAFVALIMEPMKKEKTPPPVENNQLNT